MKLLYKPFGLILGIVAGRLSGKLFDAIWGRVEPYADQPPQPRTKDTTATRAISAAALQAAVFAGVRAGVDRAGARMFEHTTGVWPEQKKKEKEPAS